MNILSEESIEGWRKSVLRNVAITPQGVDGANALCDMALSAHALKAEIESLKASYIKACELAEQNRAKLHALESQLKQAKEVVAFFASVIKSGEPWTATCHQALAALSDNAELKETHENP